jgi:hypothetical protein
MKRHTYTCCCVCCVGAHNAWSWPCLNRTPNTCAHTQKDVMSVWTRHCMRVFECMLTVKCVWKYTTVYVCGHFYLLVCKKFRGHEFCVDAYQCSCFVQYACRHTNRGMYISTVWIYVSCAICMLYDAHNCLISCTHARVHVRCMRQKYRTSAYCVAVCKHACHTHLAYACMLVIHMLRVQDVLPSFVQADNGARRFEGLACAYRLFVSSQGSLLCSCSCMGFCDCMCV